MNIVLGLERGVSSDALTLVKRLRFSGACFDLNHVIKPFPWASTGTYYVGMPVSAPPLVQGDEQAIRQQEEEDANAVLLSASTHLTAVGKCTTHVSRGNPTEMLMERADADPADLIAVNAPHQGPVLAFLTGSVARGLVIGAHQSVLLARGDSQDTGDAVRPVRAVLATDHSTYMDRCIDQLIRFRPQGLEHLTVLTAYPEARLDGRHSHIPHLAVNPAGAMRRDLEEKNRSLVQRLGDALAPSSVTITSQVSGEPIERTVTDVMKETDAELLILGAHGHTFFERLTLGSFSFQQAMTAPYSVLVLRVGRTEAEEIHTAAKAGNGFGDSNLSSTVT